jgi:cell division protein FtsX
MKWLSLTFIAAFTLSAQVQQNIDYAAKTMEQLKVEFSAKIQEAVKNLPEETKAKIEEAKKAQKQVQELESSGKESEASKLVEQYRIQSQEKIQQELSELPEHLKEKVRSAMIKIEAYKEQRQLQFKESCNK